MAEEPIDEFFTNLYIHSQMKRREAEDHKMQELESKVRADHES